MISVTCPTAVETMALGRRLASLLRAGDVVLLSGSLGAGKTAFASGLAEGLGVDELVTSTSFVIEKRYEGLMPMVHVDVYRLGSSGEFEDLDLIDGAVDGVLVIEWGQAVAAGVPADHLVVEFEVADDGARTISLIPKGLWQARPLKELEL